MTTPLPILTLIAIGFVATVRRLAAERLPLAQTMVLAWALIPPLIQIALSSPLYNGTRHFLFVYPAMARLAGTGAVALIDALRLRVAGAAGVAVAMLSVVPAMVQLHPVLMRGDQHIRPVLEHFVARDVQVSTLRDHGDGTLPPPFDYYVAVRRQQVDPNY